LDDYSRYVVGLEVFRSQTAEHVLEVYRRAVAEYGVPKEMLSDQGRQYSSWRGTTRFEAELRKDRVHHIKSRPHHPMTLGKIERFWKTIWEDPPIR
jgi:transposase InsO family protein